MNDRHSIKRPTEIKMGKCILVTGGTGYVGVHVVVELQNAGYDCVVIDSLVNSREESLKRAEQLTGKKVEFDKTNLLDKNALDEAFAKHSFFAVIHCAGLKAVGESVDIPLTYYHNNVTGTINLLQCMEKHNCRNIVFSSSATVYGNPQYQPLDEKHPVGIGITNPYGRSKYFIEEIIRDFAKTKKDWNTILLRYTVCRLFWGLLTYKFWCHNHQSEVWGGEGS